jgi:hypothetical protein
MRPTVSRKSRSHPGRVPEALHLLRPRVPVEYEHEDEHEHEYEDEDEDEDEDE